MEYISKKVAAYGQFVLVSLTELLEHPSTNLSYYHNMLTIKQKCMRIIFA